VHRPHSFFSPSRFLRRPLCLSGTRRNYGHSFKQERQWITPNLCVLIIGQRNEVRQVNRHLHLFFVFHDSARTHALILRYSIQRVSSSHKFPRSGTLMPLTSFICSTYVRGLCHDQSQPIRRLVSEEYMAHTTSEADNRSDDDNIGCLLMYRHYSPAHASISRLAPQTPVRPSHCATWTTRRLCSIT
jgi:hypothetical protein